jgi:hypothetical protein
VIRAIIKLAGRMLAAPPTSSGDRLGGARAARPAGHHARADDPLVLSGGASRLARGRAHCLVAPSRLRPARRRQVPRGGDNEDDNNMLLQSTAALATSPLHDGSGDGSSSDETPRSPAFLCLAI